MATWLKSGGHFLICQGQRELRISAYLNTKKQCSNINKKEIFIGKGIRLFQETDTENNLKLIESKAFDYGLVQLKYRKS